MKKLINTFLAILISSSLAVSQDKKNSEPYNEWEFGINAGVASFTGEYNMFKDARFNHFNLWNSEMNPGVGASARKNFSNIFALEAMWNFSNLTGTWKYDTRPMVDFKTAVNEYNLSTVWNITNLLSKSKNERKIFWYAKIGIGASHLLMKSGANSLNDEHLKVPTIPLGTGLSIRLNDQVKVSLGTQWSWVNTDRLDGRRTDMISGNVKPGNTESDIFGTKIYTQIGFSYAFGKRKMNKSLPVVEVPKSEPTPEPKPESKSHVQLNQPITVKPSVIGNSYKVYFGFNKFDLDPQGFANLDKLAKELEENPTVKVEIKSHTDSRGSVSYNLKLSEKRGKSVVNYLVKKGIDVSRVNLLALGKSLPVNKCAEGINCSKAEYAQNRRTETVITE